jgi:hypothetical protein
MRPVIQTMVRIDGRLVPVELTLANRVDMGFRMLLGRLALRDRFVVDSGRSYLGGKPPKKKDKPVARRSPGAETAPSESRPTSGEQPS